ncbi:hypothetical protein [Streptomyces sp. URMC 129]|uniref:hypothetical protein n=1 Tax=Streptomyces sp. URMC 129 TaxID=3423407 RepID=UPI003F1AB411
MSVRPDVPGRPLSWGPNKLPVPFAAAWSEEKPTVRRSLTVRPDGTGLAYVDETPADRDAHGVLWARLRNAPGEGRPDFRKLHSQRQRHAMLRKLCQVCGGPASRTGQGWLFLLQRHGSADEQSADWPEGALSAKPPICRSCAALAVRHCPHLTEPLVIRSRKPRVWGVFGGFIGPSPDGRLISSPTDDCLPYGDPASPWFLASQLLIELTRCTETDLDTELAADRGVPGCGERVG